MLWTTKTNGKAETFEIEEREREREGEREREEEDMRLGWESAGLGMRNAGGSGFCLPPHHNTVVNGESVLVCLCVCAHIL